MIKFSLRTAILLGIAVLLASCLEPKTPQQVTRVFWKAVVNKDVASAVKYSTLSEAKYYDAFDKDWKGYQPKWGRVTIDESKASIVSEFSAPANSGQQDRKFLTYLIKQNDTWKVDYDRTKTAVNGGILNQLIGQLDRFGDDLSRQLDASGKRFRLEMDKLSRQLEKMAESFDKQARRISGEYLDELRRNIQALEDSINRALRDDDQLNDRDREVLRVAADNLQQEDAALSQPSAASLSQSARRLGETRQQLDSLDSTGVKKYQQEWDQLADRIEKNIRDILMQMQASIREESG